MTGIFSPVKLEDKGLSPAVCRDVRIGMSRISLARAVVRHGLRHDIDTLECSGPDGTLPYVVCVQELIGGRLVSCMSFGGLL